MIERDVTDPDEPGPESTDSGWVSAHLFHRGDLDALVTGVVSPVIRELTAIDALAGFHFLRDWEGGPHIRLRMLPAPSHDAGLLRSALLAHGSRYLAEHPSPSPAGAGAAYRALATRLARAEGRIGYEPRLRPVDTIEFVPYLPPSDEHGNEAARTAVETHFTESSRIVLRLLDAGVPMQRRHAVALGMLMLTVAVVEPDIESAARRVRAAAPAGASQPAGAALRRRALDLWACAAGTGRVPLRGPLLAWLRSVRILRQQLHDARRHGPFAAPQHRSPLTLLGAAAGPAAYGVAPVLLRGTHLVCNRLGITADAESRLASVVARTLVELDEEATTPPSVSHLSRLRSPVGRPAGVRAS